MAEDKASGSPLWMIAQNTQKTARNTDDIVRILAGITTMLEKPEEKIIIDPKEMDEKAWRSLLEYITTHPSNQYLFNFERSFKHPIKWEKRWWKPWTWFMRKVKEKREYPYVEENHL